MRKTPSSFTRIFLIMLLITGVIPTLTSISLIDAEAFSEKTGLKQNIENDYQKMYKQRDFEKYLSHQYEFYKEYTEYYDDLLNGMENENKPSSITNENFKENNDDDDDKKSKQSNTDDDDAKDEFTLKSDWKKKDFAADKIYSSSDKSEKKKYKSVQIIECSNLNINAYEVEDFSDVETLLNKAPIFQNDDNQNELQLKNNKEAKEYNIGSDTKIIFICNNENQNFSPNNSPNDSNDIISSLPDEGIMLPVNSPNNNNYNNNHNNNNDNDNEITTTVP